MKSFNNALQEYLLNDVKTRPSWSRHIPDELCLHIQSVDDLMDLIDFAGNNEDGSLLEFDCDETERFLQRIPRIYADPEVRKYADSKGISEPLGYLAYVIVLSLGNE